MEEKIFTTEFSTALEGVGFAPSLSGAAVGAGVGVVDIGGSGGGEVCALAATRVASNRSEVEQAKRQRNCMAQGNKDARKAKAYLCALSYALSAARNR
ncbi:MAG: hypothetical protein ACXWGY_08090 [Chthoniobacterales bacterium]